MTREAPGASGLISTILQRLSSAPGAYTALGRCDSRANEVGWRDAEVGYGQLDPSFSPAEMLALYGMNLRPRNVATSAPKLPTTAPKPQRVAPWYMAYMPVPATMQTTKKATSWPTIVSTNLLR